MKPLSIGIACYPTWGGSGVIATEIGMAMARAGHRVHVIANERPVRLDADAPNVLFHPVKAAEYPVFPAVPYSLALASRMVQVAREHGLDVLHAHYAIPHAASAWMAREVLGGEAPKLVTTLHGTDITLVGADESYLPITRHSIRVSDAVTTPSAFLRDETWARFELDCPITVIPNFVDTERFRPIEGAARPHLVELFGPDGARVPTIVHTSNMRPVKRLDRVVEAFALVAAEHRAHLLLIGEGPDREQAERRLGALGLLDRVRFLGEVEDLEGLLRECAAFHLPSETESFGLAALEALASGVPVVASRVGGLPEVIRDGQTGFLVEQEDIAGMARALGTLVGDRARRVRMAAAARADAVERFRLQPLVARYEELYRSL